MTRRELSVGVRQSHPALNTFRELHVERSHHPGGSRVGRDGCARDSTRVFTEGAGVLSAVPDEAIPVRVWQNEVVTRVFSSSVFSNRIRRACFFAKSHDFPSVQLNDLEVKTHDIRTTLHHHRALYLRRPDGADRLYQLWQIKNT